MPYSLGNVAFSEGNDLEAVVLAFGSRFNAGNGDGVNAILALGHGVGIGIGAPAVSQPVVGACEYVDVLGGNGIGYRLSLGYRLRLSYGLRLGNGLRLRYGLSLGHRLSLIGNVIVGETEDFLNDLQGSHLLLFVFAVSVLAHVANELYGNISVSGLGISLESVCVGSLVPVVNIERSGLDAVAESLVVGGLVEVTNVDGVGQIILELVSEHLSAGLVSCELTGEEGTEGTDVRLGLELGMILPLGEVVLL